MGFSSLAIDAEERVAVREHAEKSVLVKKAIDDLVVADWVVQNVPEAVLKILKSLLEILWELVHCTD